MDIVETIVYGIVITILVVGFALGLKEGFDDDNKDL
jgi:predicted transporter